METKKICLGDKLIVDFSLYAKKDESVTPNALAVTLTGYVTTASQAATLANYATKTYVTDALAGLTRITMKKVDVLPAVGEENIIYLVPKKSGSVAENAKDEYVWLNGQWELIGSTVVSLEGYVTTSDLTSVLSQYLKTDDLPAKLALYAKTADVTTNIALAKSQAIAAAETDATTKANGALASAKTYADGKIVEKTEAEYNAMPAGRPKSLYILS